MHGGGALGPEHIQQGRGANVAQREHSFVHHCQGKLGLDGGPGAVGNAQPEGSLLARLEGCLPYRLDGEGQLLGLARNVQVGIAHAQHGQGRLLRDAAQCHHADNLVGDHLLGNRDFQHLAGARQRPHLGAFNRSPLLGDQGHHPLEGGGHQHARHLPNLVLCLVRDQGDIIVGVLLPVYELLIIYPEEGAAQHGVAACVGGPRERGVAAALVHGHLEGGKAILARRHVATGRQGIGEASGPAAGHPVCQFSVKFALEDLDLDSVPAAQNPLCIGGGDIQDKGLACTARKAFGAEADVKLARVDDDLAAPAQARLVHVGHVRLVGQQLAAQGFAEVGVIGIGSGVNQGGIHRNRAHPRVVQRPLAAAGNRQPTDRLEEGRGIVILPAPIAGQAGHVEVVRAAIHEPVKGRPGEAAARKVGGAHGSGCRLAAHDCCGARLHLNLVGGRLVFCHREVAVKLLNLAVIAAVAEAELLLREIKAVIARCQLLIQLKVAVEGPEGGEGDGLLEQGSFWPLHLEGPRLDSGKGKLGPNLLAGDAAKVDGLARAIDRSLGVQRTVQQGRQGIEGHADAARVYKEDRASVGAEAGRRPLLVIADRVETIVDPYSFVAGQRLTEQTVGICHALRYGNIRKGKLRWLT